MKNIDTTGRLIRLGASLILFACAFWLKSWIALIFALFVLVESALSWCIVYQLLGKNSCPIKKNKK
jgi:hypothetical protein